MSSRGLPVTKAIRAGRRAAAEKRQAEYDKLSLDEKLAKLPAEPHAAKQRAKLTALKNVAKQSRKVGGALPQEGAIERLEEAGFDVKKLKNKKDK